MRPGQLLSLESTTWPGTTDEVIAPRLHARGLEPGRDCALVFSPERDASLAARRVTSSVHSFTP